jgi:hypothetical protein
MRFAASFIGRPRDQLLNETLFRLLQHTGAVLETWRVEGFHLLRRKGNFYWATDEQ